MSDSTLRTASDIDLMTEVAMLYYLENVTQEAIANVLTCPAQKSADCSNARVTKALSKCAFCSIRR